MVDIRLRLQRLDLIHLKFGVVYTLCMFEFVQVPNGRYSLPLSALW